MQWDVINLESESVGTIDLADSVFGLEARADILSRAVTWQLAKRRAGTHSTKTRGEVARTGKKPYRQKGTGRARQGSTKGPQMRAAASSSARDRAITRSICRRRCGSWRSARRFRQSAPRVSWWCSTRPNWAKQDQGCWHRTLAKLGWSKPLVIDADKPRRISRAPPATW